MSIPDDLLKEDARLHLEAAAPELYESLVKTAAALRVAIKCAISRDLFDSTAEWQASVDSHALLVEARAALAKARGEQS